MQIYFIIWVKMPKIDQHPLQTFLTLPEPKKRSTNLRGRLLLMRWGHTLRWVTDFYFVRLRHLTSIDRDVDLVEADIARSPIGAICTIVIRSDLF